MRWRCSKACRTDSGPRRMHSSRNGLTDCPLGSTAMRCRTVTHVSVPLLAGGAVESGAVGIALISSCRQTIVAFSETLGAEQPPKGCWFRPMAVCFPPTGCRYRWPCVIRVCTSAPRCRPISSRVPACCCNSRPSPDRRRDRRGYPTVSNLILTDRYIQLRTPSRGGELTFISA